ncbi:ParB family protein [Leifsonia xyli]|uniref:ParB family protein n=1 Tax=Leifsonia xyli TaxID=1575 RepID=UPI00269646FC
MSFYQHPEDTARVPGATLNTITTEGARSLSQFMPSGRFNLSETVEGVDSL